MIQSCVLGKKLVKPRTKLKLNQKILCEDLKPLNQEDKPSSGALDACIPVWDSREIGDHWFLFMASRSNAVIR